MCCEIVILFYRPLHGNQNVCFFFIHVPSFLTYVTQKIVTISTFLLYYFLLAKILFYWI